MRKEPKRVSPAPGSVYFVNFRFNTTERSDDEYTGLNDSITNIADAVPAPTSSLIFYSDNEVLGMSNELDEFVKKLLNHVFEQSPNVVLNEADEMLIIHLNGGSVVNAAELNLAGVSQKNLHVQTILNEKESIKLKKSLGIQ